MDRESRQYGHIISAATPLVGAVVAWFVVRGHIDELTIADVIMVISFIVALAIFLGNIVDYRAHLGTIVLSDGTNQEWSFTDWAGTLTTVGGALSLILAVQNNGIFTGLALFCGILLIAAPVVYNAAFQRRGRVWAFFLVTAITLGAVGSELGAAVFLADGLQATKLFGPWSFQLILLGAILGVIVYDFRTTRRIVQNSIT